MMDNTVQTALDRANGKRRHRTLALPAVEVLLHELAPAPGSIATEHAGHVAGAYSYPSQTTVLFAVRRTDGLIALAIGATSASAGSSTRPAWIAQEVPTVKSTAAALAWADKAITGLRADGGIIIVDIN
jgi:hypothetical protein